jgi:hypothetical protein
VIVCPAEIAVTETVAMAIEGTVIAPLAVVAIEMGEAANQALAIGLQEIETAATVVAGKAMLLAIGAVEAVIVSATAVCHGVLAVQGLLEAGPVASAAAAHALAARVVPPVWEAEGEVAEAVGAAEVGAGNCNDVLTR